MAARLPALLQTNPSHLREDARYELTFITGGTVNYKPRNEEGAAPWALIGTTGDVYTVDGGTVEWVALDPNNPDPNVTTVRLDRGITKRAANQTVSLSGFSTLVGHVEASASVPNGTNTNSGSSPVAPKGSRIFFSLSVGGVLATAGDECQQQVAGVTSGLVYAVAAVGDSTTGYFDMVETAEALRIVQRNGDTAAHWMSGTITIATP